MAVCGHVGGLWPISRVFIPSRLGAQVAVSLLLRDVARVLRLMGMAHECTAHTADGLFVVDIALQGALHMHHAASHTCTHYNLLKHASLEGLAQVLAIKPHAMPIIITPRMLSYSQLFVLEN